MLDLRLCPTPDPEPPATLVLPVRPAGVEESEEDGAAALACAASLIDAALLAVVTALLVEEPEAGKAGALTSLRRPGETPSRVYLLGWGEPDGEDALSAARKAGAAVVRRCAERESATVFLPDAVAAPAVAAFVEGARLAGYHYSLASDPKPPKLSTVDVVLDGADQDGAAVERATVVAEATALARDWVNTPPNDKSPAWLAGQVAEYAAAHGVTATVLDTARLQADGFGGVLAVGSGSSRPPFMVELDWNPSEARAHVVLVGKGITFDTGGISLKPMAGMALMKKDMAGGAAVAAATVAAARLRLPVRVTTLVPIAENMLGAASYRPGDVVRHYGGRTTEVINTDAEGRMVLADALAYASERYTPDVVVDLATLTGAQKVALGKRTAALFTADDAVADALVAAGAAAGELMWRMPMPAHYLEDLRSPVADLSNVVLSPEAGASIGAVFLREFVAGDVPWAHLDMSAPAWSDAASDELTKGATGWGVRTLVNYLESMSSPAAG